MKKLLIALTLLPTIAFSQPYESPEDINAWKEYDYALAYCSSHEGQLEYKVEAGRIDCLRDNMAVEVEYAPKWKEAIAQAQWYSLKTGKMPGILFITRKESDEKYIEYTKEYLWKTGQFINIEIYMGY
jgi:hypothetical protein